MQVQNVAAVSLYSPAGVRKYLTASERIRFISASEKCGDPRLRTFCLVLAYSGCRISEGLALTPGRFEIESGFVAVRSLKKRGAFIIREIPMPAFVLAAVAEQDGFEEAGRRLWPWSRPHAWFLIKQVMAEAGIAPGVHASPKGLRHGFGLHAIRSGVPLNLVQRWLGHARMETTAIYLQAMGSEEQELAARMWVL